MLALLFSGGQGTPQPGIDLGGTIRAAFPALGGRSEAQIVFWTEAELYGFANEAAKRLAKSGLWAKRVPISFSVSQSQAALPPDVISLIHATWESTAILPMSELELSALDEGWSTRVANPNPTHYLREEFGFLTVFPLPTQLGNVNVVYFYSPGETSAVSPFLQMPGCLEPYISLGIIEAARRMESDGAMPEVSAACGQLMGLLYQAAEGYWGGAL